MNANMKSYYEFLRVKLSLFIHKLWDSSGSQLIQYIVEIRGKEVEYRKENGYCHDSGMFSQRWLFAYRKPILNIVINVHHNIYKRTGNISAGSRFKFVADLSLYIVVTLTVIVFAFVTKLIKPKS